MKWPDCPLKRGNSYSYFKDIHPPIFEFKTLKLFLEFLQSDDTPRILKTPNIDTYYICPAETDLQVQMLFDSML